MAYPAKSIANAFISIAAADGESVSNMKLQKLLYFAHAVYLGTQNKPLISESPEAWQFGPVFPSVYHEFKGFRADPIDCYATDFNFKNLEIERVEPPEDTEVLALLKSVWETYGQMSAIKLSALSHVPGGPWDRVRKEANGSVSADIPNSYIQEDFSKAVAEAKATA